MPHDIGPEMRAAVNYCLSQDLDFFSARRLFEISLIEGAIVKCGKRKDAAVKLKIAYSYIARILLNRRPDPRSRSRFFQRKKAGEA